ncbi:MAG TPA: hypothetical protein VFA20_04565, partial [Myxococcaceae bacterium]|nr:hypothetical protein [Myxococcaceae bacterium]
DEEEMAACVVDEYLRMGFGRAEILRMFADPFYRLTHGVQARRGEAWVRDLVDRVFRRWNGGTVWPT